MNPADHYQAGLQTLNAAKRLIERAGPHDREMLQATRATGYAAIAAAHFAAAASPYAPSAWETTDDQ